MTPLAAALLLDGMLDEGGAQAQAVAIAEELAARGHDVAFVSRWPIDARVARVRALRAAGVHVITPKWQGRPLERVRPCEYNLRRAVWAMRSGRQTAEALAAREQAVNSIVARRLTRWLAARGLPAVLHVLARHSGAIIPAVRRLGLPIVFTEFGQVGHYEHRPTRFDADAYTADSSTACEVLRSIEGRDVAYVPSTGGFPEPTAPVPVRARRFVTISRLSPEKRLDVAARGAALAGVELDVFGSGPESGRLEEFVAELGPSVRLRGPVDRDGVRRALDEADGFVLASETEGLPTALVEAMSRGRAIVATDVGGIGEVARDGREALFFDGSPGDLARRLTRLAGDDGLAARLGAAARARWEEELAPRVVVDRYELVYRAVLAA